MDVCLHITPIENLKHSEMLDPLGQAGQNGSALAAKTSGRVAVNKHFLCGSLLSIATIEHVIGCRFIHSIFMVFL